MKLVFMGTPVFSLACLEALIEAGHEVAAVFTQQDKPRNRGKQVQMTPVKECALKHGIAVYQPASLRKGEDAEKSLEALREINPDCIVVVAYGQILPKTVLELPKYGCVNVHASLLPRFRGAAPIQRCIQAGDTKTGVCTMQMDEGLDTGDILLVEKTEIGENETAGELFDRLAPMGAELLIKTLVGLENGEITPIKQNDSESTYASMLDKSMSPVDFNRSAREVHNKIRGLDPWPVALTHLEGKTLKLFGSTVSDELKGGKPGETKTLKNGLAVFCGDGKAVIVSQVQFEGKKRMNAADFLRGHPIPDGTVLQ